MTTKVGLDMDGVIVNNDPVWKEYYDSNYDLHNHKELHCGIPPTWNYIYELCSICFDQVVNNPTILAKSVPMPGAIEGVFRLSMLKDENNQSIELWLVSHRSPELTGVATNVIRKFGILPCFTNMDWGWGNKLETCLNDGISILVDDGPKNIIALRNSPVTAIIYDWPYNRHLNGLRAYNWDDVTSICTSLLKERVCV